MISCRICEGKNLTLAIDLQQQPVANLFLRESEVGKEKYYPLQVFYCQDCSAAQLGHTVPKEAVYEENTYLSGMTRTLDLHFKKVAEDVDDLFFKEQAEKKVLDIGSNDGTQLIHFKNLGYEIVGIEAAWKIAKLANERRVYTVHAFFNEECAKTLPMKFDVINAAGIFFHLEELHSATEGIRLLLKENGVFIIQFLYMKCIMENRAFDQIYHEHLLYYTLQTVDQLLKKHGLCLFDATISSIHGGSVIAYAGHQGKRQPSKRLTDLKNQEVASGCNLLSSYQRLAQSIDRLKERNIAFLEQKKHEGKCIYGMGAPVKGNTLLNYFGIGKKLIDCLVEKNPLRKGLYSPGMHLPIILEQELSFPPDVYYVLAWNFKREILKNNAHLIDRGIEFYFPIESALQ
jgi:SAM-dependent methyltransferase